MLITAAVNLWETTVHAMVTIAIVPQLLKNNCQCGKTKGNILCDDNCNCYTTQAPPPSVSEGPTKLENTSMASFWPGLI